jgi:transcriptional regulator with XRE-family HTH domain
MASSGASRRGSTRAELETERRERDVRRAFGLDLRRQLEDAGLSQAALAKAAHLSPAQVSRILAGSESPSLHAMAALSVGLDGKLVVRVEPGTGPRIRDRFQARMVEALIRELNLRWKRFLEVAVYRPVRGYVDLAIHDPAERVVLRPKSTRRFIG